MFTKCFRILAATFLSLSIFLSSSSTALAVPAFVNDVPEPVNGEFAPDAPWYSRPVYYLYFAHVVDAAGHSDDGSTLYDPSRAITRGQFVTFLGRLANECDREVEQESKWELSEKDCIKWAETHHILYGRGRGLAENDALTREEMGVIMVRFVDYMQIKISESPLDGIPSKFADFDSVSSWAKEDFKRACGMGLLNGEVKRDGAKAIQPQRRATRAEAAQVVHNYVKLADIHLPYYAGDVGDLAFNTVR